MKKTKLLFFVFPILFVGCSEFSETEESVIKSGRLYNEAIASEFYDTFIDYWNETIWEELEKASDDFSDQAMGDISNVYMFWGDNLLSDAYVGAQERKAKTLYNMADNFHNSYEGITQLLKSRIGINGLKATADTLNATIANIENGDSEWMYDEENEGAFPVKLGMIIAHPRYGFHPDNINSNYGYDFGSVPWRLYYMNTADSGSIDNCIYAALKLIQKWLDSKQEEVISVVYCAPYEDSLNSYLVGYSNHRSFLITFLRNNDEKCHFEWQEMEYESSYVGNSLLD